MLFPEIRAQVFQPGVADHDGDRFASQGAFEQLQGHASAVCSTHLIEDFYHQTVLGIRMGLETERIRLDVSCWTTI